MTKSRLDISLRRFRPSWLILGALIGTALGKYGGMNFAFWYFASPIAVIGWQIFGAIVGALFVSLLMTSAQSRVLKASILGAGIGFACAFYGASVWAMFPSNADPPGLAGISVAEGIFLDWLILHSAIFGFFIGWIVGALIARRGHAVAENEAPSTESPENHPGVEKV